MSTGRFTEMKRVAREIFILAELSGATEEDVKQALQTRVYDKLYTMTKGGKPRFSEYETGYLQGMIDADMRAIENDKIEDVLKDAAGKLYSLDERGSYPQAGNMKVSYLRGMERAQLWRKNGKEYRGWQAPM